MTVWLERLRPNDLQIMIPQVLLTLDRIRDQAMEPERRLSMLRALKDQVEAILAALPESASRTAMDELESSPAAPALTLKQRLSRSWCMNLQRLLADLGRPRYAGYTRFSVYREWTLRQLLRGYEQGIESAVRSEQTPATGTWKALHDLFVYLEGRGELDGLAATGRPRVQPGTQYKRLLLIGAIGGYVNTGRILRDIGPRLSEWAAASDLRPADGALDESHLLWIDVSRDDPPRRRPRSVDAAYQGWILDPARAFSDYLDLYEGRPRVPSTLRETTRVS